MSEPRSLDQAAGVGVGVDDPELAARIAALSPAQRERFEKLLRDRLDRPDPAAVGRAAGAGPWPASFGQERMWVGSSDDTVATATDNYATGLRLTGPLNLPALHAAVLRVVQRHEALRTTFALRSGALVQCVEPGARVPWRTVDLTGLGLGSGEEPPAEVGALIGREVRRPFDLERGPLLRVTVLRFAAEDHCLLLTIHHAVTDGWSNGVLVGELAAGYADAVAGRPWSHAPLPMQYRDFAVWQRERVSGSEAAALEEFWAEQIRDLPVPALPSDAVHAAQRGDRIGANHMAVLDAELAARLDGLRRAEGGSHFMLVLAALVAVLREVTGQDDVVVGTLTSGRTRPELEPLVGYFVNVLMLRFRVAGSPTFRRLWEAVREQATQAYAHQEMPFEKVMEMLRAQEGIGLRAPIRVLCLPHAPAPVPALAGLGTSALDVDLGNAPFDVVIEARQTDDGLRISLQYDGALFTDSTVRRLADLLEQVLRGAVADLDIPVPEMLAAAAVDVLPAAGFDRPSIAAAFEAAVVARPDAVAVVEGGQRLTYRALNARANQLAGFLRGIGAGCEDRVGILLPRSADAVTAVLAVLKAGAAFVMFDPADPAGRIADLAADAGLRALVSISAFGETVAELPVPVVLLDRDRAEIGAYSARNLGLPAHPDQLAYLVYTSGSTGRPKAVAGPQRGLLNRVSWTQAVHPVEPSDICALRTSPTFVDAVWEMLGPLLAGASLAVVPAAVAADAEALLDLLAAERVTRMVVVPGLLQMLLAASPSLGARLPALAVWTTSGEELRAELAARFLAAAPGRLLLNLYGSSEVAADATAVVVSDPVPTAVPIGRAIDGATAWIGQDGVRPRPALAVGEIYVGGEGVARGYHGRPELTARAFRPDPLGVPGGRLFHTGDVGRLLADGQIGYLGRRDGQVQIRGHRVEPGEVEAVLLRHAGVRAAVVVARPDTTGAATLVGYYVPDADADADAALPETLRRYLRSVLPSHLVPSAFVELSELPTTAGGKIDRTALPAPTGSVLPDAVAGPVSGAEGPLDVVSATFAEMLGLERVAPDDDFFLIGGHSVLATALVRQLGERLGVKIGLADLFAEPTAAGLAARAAKLPRRDEGEDAEPVVLPADPEGRYEPFPMTDVQAAYYVGRGSDLRLGGVSTHAYLEVEVEDLDPAGFQSALRAVVARHPMLRAVVRPDGTQQVLEHVPDYEVRTADLSALDPVGREAALADVRRTMSHQVLNSHAWPMFDVRASLLGRQRAVLHVSIDSLICDAYSFGLVMDELTLRYREPDTQLPDIQATFRDYVRHRTAITGTPRHAAALEYWRERLADLPTGPELPAGRASELPAGQTAGLPGSLRAAAPAGRTGELLASRVADLPAGQTADLPAAHRFHRRLGRLPAPAWTAFKERAASAGLTPSAVLLAAFAEVLTRWSRRPHYSIMLTVFDREPVHPEVGAIVGDFTSLSLLEVDHRQAGAFVERAGQLQRRLWSDLDHASVSGVAVNREWALSRGLEPQALTPIVFTSNLPMAGVAAGPGRPAALGELGYAITQTPQVHLDHQVSEQDGELLFNWDTVDDLFAPGVLDAMFEAYQGLLDALAESPGVWERPVGALLPREQGERRARVNATDATLPTRCLHEAVAEAAARYPERVAVVSGEVRLTYAELVSRARRIGRTLRSLGAKPNTLVGVSAERGWQQVVAALGVLESGAAFLPLDPHLPADRLAHLAARGGVQTVLTTADLLDRMPDLAGAKLLAVDGDGDGDGDSDSTLDPDDSPLNPAQGLDDLAYVIFTSGSTGEPKGVAIDHRGAANTIACVNDYFAVGPDDKVLAVSSLSFDLAVYDVFGLLAAGGALVIPDHARRRDPGHWAALVRRERITLWNSVPALAELLADHAEALAPDALTSLRAVLLSGDWIPVSLPDRIRALTGTRVTSLGGATEASIWSVWYPVRTVRPDWRSIPYGHPMANQSVYVLDDSMRPRPDWVPGELYIGGVGVALGYWGDEELTERSFVRGPDGERLYRTGDIARHLPDGELEFLGREDFQVKISGYRIELAEIETALERDPVVRAAAVVAVGAAGTGKRLVAHVVPADPARFTLEAAKANLARSLPDYMVPAAWVTHETLPLTSNGKVDHSVLRSWAGVGTASGSITGAGAAELSSAPPTATAVPAELLDEVCELWAEVLGVPRVDPADGFFALGGTSLTAIRMLSRVQGRWDAAVTLPELFTANTVEAFAAVLATAQRGAQAQPLPVIHPDTAGGHEPFPLTGIQQAYWLGRRAGNALGGVATHSYLELEVADLDLARLESAVRAVIERHDALRTVVRPDGLQQVLADPPPFRVPLADLRGRSPEAADQAREQLREQMSHEVRDLGSWPLFEIRAQRVDDVHTRLHLSFDLMTVDARSMQIVTGEMLAFYAGAADLGPAPGLGFRDYVLAVEQMRAGDRYTRDLDYWRSRLPDLPPAPALPLLQRPDEVTGATFVRLSTGLAAADWQAVREWAAAAGLTPSAVVGAAFCEVLAAYSESPRFTLNVTTFSRIPVHPDVEALVGDFTTTTLLAVDVPPGDLTAGARRFQDRLWQDLEHRLVGGVDVLRMLRRERGARAEALMPVVFTSTLFSDSVAPSAAAWSARPVHTVSQTPQVLLDHQATEHEGRLICSWDYVSAIFPPGLIDSMFESFDRALISLTVQARTSAMPSGEADL
jgi:amino acid adenylation domain-containing protein